MLCLQDHDQIHPLKYRVQTYVQQSIVHTQAIVIRGVLMRAVMKATYFGPQNSYLRLVNNGVG